MCHVYFAIKHRYYVVWCCMKSDFTERKLTNWENWIKIYIIVSDVAFVIVKQLLCMTCTCLKLAFATMESNSICKVVHTLKNVVAFRFFIMNNLYIVCTQTNMHTETGIFWMKMNTSNKQKKEWMIRSREIGNDNENGFKILSYSTIHQISPFLWMYVTILHCGE